MKIKHGYMWLVAFLSVLPVGYTQAQKSLFVKLNNGSESALLLTSLNKITFSGGNMLISRVDASNNSYAVSDVRRLTFGVYSGVESTFSDDLALAVYPCPATDYILLKNLSDGNNRIRIYSIDGTLTIDQTLTSTTDKIDVSRLAKGLYILLVNDKTVKFTK